MAQAAAPTLAPELVSKIHAIAFTFYSDIMANASDEQKNIYFGRHMKMQQDQEFKEANMARLATDWNESDADQDGKLNLAEFRTFFGKLCAVEREAGCYVRDLPDTETEEMFSCMNQVSEGDGIVLTDFYVYMGAFMTKFYMMKHAMSEDKEA